MIQIFSLHAFRVLMLPWITLPLGFIKNITQSIICFKIHDLKKRERKLIFLILIKGYIFYT